MTDDKNPKNADLTGQPSNRQKDPEDWTTGDERMTGAQASYLKTLSEEAGEEFNPDLTKAQASERIDALQSKTGRGQGVPDSTHNDPRTVGNTTDKREG